MASLDPAHVEAVVREALDRRHHLNTADLAAHIAAALAPLIESRVREAWDEGYNDGLKDTEERLPNPYGEDVDE